MTGHKIGRGNHSSLHTVIIYY